MKKFIFSVMAISLMGIFASCDECKSTTENVENDSTIVDSTKIDSTQVVDTTVVDTANVDTATIQK